MRAAQHNGCKNRSRLSNRHLINVSPGYKWRFLRGHVVGSSGTFTPAGLCCCGSFEFRDMNIARLRQNVSVSILRSLIVNAVIAENRVSMSKMWSDWFDQSCCDKKIWFVQNKYRFDPSFRMKWIKKLILDFVEEIRSY